MNNQHDTQELKAGPELDAKVAEALGYEIRVCDVPMMTVWHRAWVYKGEKYIWLEEEGRQPEKIIPQYSTSLEDAWEIFAAATKTFGQVQIASDMEEWDETHPVTISIPELYGVLWRPFPEAMCLAFLGAIEASKEKANAKN